MIKIDHLISSIIKQLVYIKHYKIWRIEQYFYFENYDR